jgi:hypothetical protein
MEQKLEKGKGKEKAKDWMEQHQMKNRWAKIRMYKERMDKEPEMIDRFDQMKGGWSRRDEIDSLHQIVTGDIQHQEDIGALKAENTLLKDEKKKSDGQWAKIPTEFAHKSKYDTDDWPAGYDRFQALMNKLKDFTTKVKSHINKVVDLKQAMTKW